MYPSPAFLSEYVLDPLRFLATPLLVVAYGAAAAACSRVRSKRSFALLILLLVFPLNYCLMEHIWGKYWFELHDNVLTVVPQFSYLRKTGVQTINLTACLFWTMAIAGTGVAVCYWPRRKGNGRPRDSS